MAMVKLFEENVTDMDKLEITQEAYRFNAFLKGNPSTRLWEQGDFLVHFAGVYDLDIMNHLINRIDNGETPRISMENRLLN